MGDNGFQISSKEIFGLDQAIESTNQIMYSTALKKIVTSAILFFTGYACFASNTPPRILKEPVLGLRYDISNTRFESFPTNETAKCETNDNMTSIWFVYGKYKTNSGRTYYILGGYDIWKKPEPNQPKYEADEYGGVFFIEGDKCVYIDEAKQTFIDRVINDEMNLQILQGLASDYAARLGKAFGGTERLRMEIHNQNIISDDLPTEIRSALKGGFPK